MFDSVAFLLFKNPHGLNMQTLILQEIPIPDETLTSDMKLSHENISSRFCRLLFPLTLENDLLGLDEWIKNSRFGNTEYVDCLITFSGAHKARN